MWKLLLILMVGLVFEAIGIVMLSRGLKQLEPPANNSASALGRVVWQGATHPQVLGGIFFEALFFFCFLVLMSRADVSFVWPLTSLGFLITTLAARFMLNEEVSLVRWCGVLLIVAGAGFITWSEQQKKVAGNSGIEGSALGPSHASGPGGTHSKSGVGSRENQTF